MSAFDPKQALELSRSRLGDQLMFILPNDVSGVSRREDIDVDTARLQRQLQLMHLLDVFSGDRLEPGQSRLPASLPSSA